MAAVFAIIAIVTGVLGAWIDPPKKCQKWRWRRTAASLVLVTCSLFCTSAAIALMLGYQTTPQNDTCSSDYDGRGAYVDCQ